MIAIIDYGAGNLNSVKNVLDYLKVRSKITSDPQVVRKAERVIFPGVGSFGATMKMLEKRDLTEVIKESITTGKPFLGICLGMQVLFQESQESLGIPGLGIFDGRAVKFAQGKVPQIGWNRIKPVDDNGLFKEGYAYFVNSYYVAPLNKEIVAATSDYFVEFPSAIKYRNVIAVQFHPEKSGSYGIGFFKRWLERC